MPLGTFVGQTIDFDEDETSPSGQMENGVNTVTITGYTTWDVLDPFISFLMPVGSSVGGIVGAQVARAPRFRVRGFAWSPFGGLTGVVAGLNAFQKVKWTIKANVPMGVPLDLNQPYTPPDPVANLIHRWSIGGMFLTIPQNRVVWASDQKAVTSSARLGQFIPTIEHSISWPRLLNPPLVAIKAAMGTINDANLTLSTGVCQKGQLLFLGAEVNTEANSDGTLSRSLTYKFSERLITAADGTPLDWNYYMRDDGGAAGNLLGWDKLALAVDNSKFTYQSSTFTKLFPAGIM